MTTSVATATFGSGCFWCGQALFKQLRGVIDVTVGYAGGTTPQPTYDQVCSGTTGHAEVFRVTYDPQVITYRQLVEVFFLSHDPTTPNRQGHDVGTQYRSLILTTDDEQAATAKAVINELQSRATFDAPIVTTVEPVTTFYPAEQYHQDYFAKNPDAAYCQAVINPKLASFKATFARLLKTDGE
jgi:peptide-methionine (S)-S-oxide reductase